VPEESADHGTADPWAQVGVAGEYAAHGGKQFLLRIPLQQIAIGTRIEGGPDVFIGFVHGQHDDSGLWTTALDLSDGRGAIEQRHRKIDDDEVRLQVPGLRHGLLPVLRLPNDLHVGQ